MLESCLDGWLREDAEQLASFFREIATVIAIARNDPDVIAEQIWQASDRDEERRRNAS